MIQLTWYIRQISLVILVWLSALVCCPAQSVYISSLPSFVEYSSLYRIDINTCETTWVADLEGIVLDICHHPDGNLYGVMGDGELVRIDTVTGDFTLLYDFPGSGFNSLVCSADGTFYSITADGIRWRYLPAGIPQYQGWAGGGSGGDLTFRFGYLYLATWDNVIMKLDPDQNGEGTVFIQGNLEENIYGIVSTGSACSDLQTFCVTSGNANEGSSLYRIDFENKVLAYYCTLSFYAGGGASPFEYLGSEELGVDSVHVALAGCNNEDNTVSFEINGGKHPLQYSIDGASFTNDSIAFNLATGLHTVQVVDSDGCMLTFDFEIPLSTQLLISDIRVVAATCVEANGAIAVEAAFGAGPYEYALDHGVFQGANEFDSLSSGNYIIEIRDANGCIADTVVTVVDIGLSSFTEMLVYPTTCGLDNGIVDIRAAHGYPPFKFALTGYPFSTRMYFDSLTPGAYQVSLRDSNGCITSMPVVIDPSAEAVIDSISVMHTTCDEANGIVHVIPMDANTFYEYSIESLAFVNSPVFADLPPGAYLFTIRDEFGCKDDTTGVILPSMAIEVATVEIFPAACSGPTGMVIVNPISWNGMLTMSMNQEDVQYPGQFNTVGSGQYQLLLSDEAGCTWDSSLVVPSVDCPVYVPNVFSPNQDGINDYFSLQGVPGAMTTVLEYLVFDRWGNLLYKAENFTAADGSSFWWDGNAKGQQAPAGVYAYKITLASSGSGDTLVTGDVTLIR